MNQFADFANSLNQTPNYLAELQKRLHTMNSSYGQSSVSISGFEIPIRRVSEGVLPAHVLFIGHEPIVVMELAVNTKESSITSKIITFNAKNVMVLKGE